ncbi:hypothetical protein CLU79DRAFT_773954 [Phycomyces nitens]|nr:hypothetical protein CLU79DRAFT_773954 [Phycomyces nitens]
MTDTQQAAIQRALEAEKQVQRLEREVQSLRTRKQTGRSKDLDSYGNDKNEFQLSEQVKDLTYQLSAKTMEMQRLKETSNARLSEYEDKLKKMRDIFAQATRNLDGYRATIATKETELAQMEEAYKDTKQSEERLRAQAEERERDFEKLKAEGSSRKAMDVGQIKRLEVKVRQLTTQLSQTQADYENYKKRAHQLLQQNTDTKDQGKFTELEHQLKQMKLEKTEQAMERSENERQARLVEQDLRQALDRIRYLEDLEIKQVALQRSLEEKNRDIKEIERQISQEREVHEQTLQTIRTAHQESLQLRYNSLPDNQTRGPEQEIKHEQTQDKEDGAINEDERAGWEAMIERLEEENRRLRETLESKETKAEIKEMVQEATPEIDSNEIDLYASMSHLLSPFVGRQEEPVDMTKQVRRLGDMLQESEEKVNALRAQEKLLKDEIRRLDSFDKRQNMNAEYLKNVLLKFLQSENKVVCQTESRKLTYISTTTQPR